MPGRGRQTFNKNQKEQKRREKQQAKVARRADRKLNPTLGPSDELPDYMMPEDSEGAEDSSSAEDSLVAKQPAERTE
jgi:hypothetical protein